MSGEVQNRLHASVIKDLSDRSHQSCFVSYLHMFFQILRTLETLSAKVTFVRLKWHMNTNVRGDMVAFDCCGTAEVPSTSQIEIVCTLSTNMALTNVFLYDASIPW